MAAARQEAALDLLPERGVMADIGAGDGLLALRLAARAGVFQVFATEFGQMPYVRLARACAGVQKIALRRGDGLVPLIGEPLDGVAVLGMGGRTILGILALATAFPRARFVLGPMQSAAELRRGLRARGLRIDDERLVVQAGRPYQLIAASLGESPPLSTLDAVLGPILRRTRPKGFRLLVERQHHLLAARLRGAGDAERQEILREIAAVEAEGDDEDL
jgi:tRNA A22 N-methylase